MRFGELRKLEGKESGEGHSSMPCEVVRSLGSALLLASAAGGDSMNVVFTIEEGKGGKS
jgi:hypothetical protein